MSTRLHGSAARPALTALACLGLACLSAVSTARPADTGVFLAGETLATPDGALSLSSNPAGLVGPSGFDARLQLNAGGDRLGVAKDAGWGGFFGIPIGPLALGASVEHDEDPLTAGTSPAWYNASRWSLGAAVALGERASVGSVARWSAVAGGTDLRSWDLGILLRPWSWLSVGARVAGLGEDGAAGGISPQPTRWGWGVAVRPLRGSDRLTLAVDAEWPDGENLSSTSALVSSRVVDGVTVAVEARHARAGGGDWTALEQQDQRIGVLFRFGLGNKGVDLAPHYGRAAGQDREAGLAAGFRWSGDVPHSMTQQGPSAVRVDLRGALSERQDSGETHFGRLILDLGRIAATPETRLVVLRAQGMQASWAQVEELRSVIGQMRAAGQRVVWHGDDLDTRALAVAAACDRIAVPAAGTLSAHGIASDYVGLQEALAKVGVAVQAVRFGAHKTAPEQLTGSTPSPELVDQVQHAMQRRWQTFTDAVSLGRQVSATALEETLARGAIFPQDALEAGLVDAVVEFTELEDRLRDWDFLAAGEDVRPDRPLAARRSRWGARPSVAIVEIEGNIADRQGGISPLGRTFGGAEMAATIREASKDSDTVGIVARVHSPGGTVLGSDLMREALSKASEDMPVVASMAGVAASGGYWLSLGADTVYADAATVTGSIGIFAMKPSLADLWQRLGVTVTPFGIGPHSHVTSLNRPWTPEELASVRKALGRYYDLFLDRTSQRRKIERNALIDLAEGRIWFGDEAVERKLVDHVGGLSAAISDVVQRADLAEAPTIRFLPEPGLFQQLQGLATGASAAGQVTASWVSALRPALGPWLDAASLAALAADGAPLALLPIDIDGDPR